MRLLLVEDQPDAARLIAKGLREQSYAVDLAADGVMAADQAANHDYDAIVLDVMLPGRDGLEICREVRTFSDVPIVMVTAKVEEIDRLLGLGLGAGDYICKPFSPREVVARVQAILRRTQRAAPGVAAGPGLSIDEASFRAAYGGRALDLTPVEFRLLRTLAAAPGRVFSRGQLLDAAYTDHRVVTDRTIDSHIKNLRRKLDAASGGVEIIHSIYGVGYRLDVGVTKGDMPI